MSFTHSSGSAHTTSGSGAFSSATSISGTFGLTPTQGHLLCVGICIGCFAGPTTVTITSVKDANNNVFTLSPHSPTGPGNGNYGQVWLAYMLSAPANINSTVTVAFNSVTDATVDWALTFDEFIVSGMPAGFHTDISLDQLTPISGNSITTPALTVPSGELLYNVYASDDGASSINSPWTAAGGGTQANGFQWGGWLLSSANGSNRINYTDVNGTGGTYGCVLAAFGQPSILQGPAGSISPEFHWLGGDNN